MLMHEYMTSHSILANTCYYQLETYLVKVASICITDIVGFL